MFSTEFLHLVREHEINEIVKHFVPGGWILEIGGGTGYQAKLLASRGFKVASIDVPASNYRGARVFPVVEYDGKAFPFKDQTFDVVFSSNTLEHIADLEPIHGESRRVLKPGGYCVHVLPTAVWRFWTIVTHYVELARRALGLAPMLLPRRFTLAEAKRAARVLLNVVGMLRADAVPPRHGETGTVFTELRTFNRRHWVESFQSHNFLVLCTQPMHLFYTGQMVFGKRWSLRSRKLASSLLGSACILYKLGVPPAKPQDGRRRGAIAISEKPECVGLRDR